MSKAIENILAERQRQKQTQLDANGITMDEFDVGNSRNDWIAYINAYTGRAAEKVLRNQREACDFRENMVKAGALAIAAVEAYDKGYC